LGWKRLRAEDPADDYVFGVAVLDLSSGLQGVARCRGKGIERYVYDTSS
jgi:hypothetical protein